MSSHSIARLLSLGQCPRQCQASKKAKGRAGWRGGAVLAGGGCGRGEEGGTWSCWLPTGEGCSTGGYWHVKDMFSIKFPGMFFWSLELQMFSNSCSLTFRCEHLNSL